jgi:hypothetical protein
LIVLAAALPATRPFPFDLCLVRRLSGIPCATCGLTRAVCLFVQGHWERSLTMHPAGWLVALGLVAAGTWMAAEAALGRTAPERLKSAAGSWFLLTAGGLSAGRWAGRLFNLF